MSVSLFVTFILAALFGFWLTGPWGLVLGILTVYLIIAAYVFIEGHGTLRAALRDAILWPIRVPVWGIRRPW